MKTNATILIRLEDGREEYYNIETAKSVNAELKNIFDNSEPPFMGKGSRFSLDKFLCKCGDEFKASKQEDVQLEFNF
jgi:hypothetical protein